MLIQHNRIQKYMRQYEKDANQFYELLQIQRRSLLLCLNALAPLPEDQAVIALVEDVLNKQKWSRNPQEVSLPRIYKRS